MPTAVAEYPASRVDGVICGRCGLTVDVRGRKPFELLRCPQCGHRLAVPLRLAHYILIEELGRGNMGVVFRALDEKLRRYVAIKVMHEELAQERHLAGRFLNEGRALAAINHPNIVQIYTCGEQAERPYIVMELVAGGRLDGRMKEQGRLPEPLVLATARDVVRGLKAASDAGLTHGDVKPQNILYDKEGAAKVVDFGLARFRGESLGKNELWGTPYYMAPEVVRMRPPTCQSDIYSLGATLFHALAGEPPFTAPSATDTILKRLKEPAPDIAGFRPDLRPATAAIVNRMIRADLFERYPTYDSLLADLDRAVNDRSPPRRPPRLPLSRSTLASAVVLCVLAVMAGVKLWVVTGGTKQARALETGDPPGLATAGGRLVPMADAQSAANEAAGPRPRVPAVGIASSFGRGGDTFISGSGAKASRESSYGHEQSIWVRAGQGAGLHLARKGYVRFDLSGTDRSRPTNVQVVLVSSPSGSNERDGRHELLLWGLKEGVLGQLWEEGGQGSDIRKGGAIGWRTAPANDQGSAVAMTGDAELLARMSVSHYPGIGEEVVFRNSDSVSPGKLLEFVAGDTDGLVTLMITADDKSPQRSGWKFASRENGRLPPPRLILTGPEPVSGRMPAGGAR